MNESNYIDIKIEKDFQNFLEILNYKIYKISNPEIKNSIKEMHKSLYINKMLSNDLFYNSRDSIISKLELNQHLLLSSILLSLFGDNYTFFFLLRGSLENFMKCIISNTDLVSTNKFSNNLELVLKREKNQILERVVRTKEKKLIKKIFNAFSSKGREELYGKYSDQIHIRTESTDFSVSHLSEFFDIENFDPNKFKKFKNNFILTVDYETMLVLLNISDLKKGKLAYKKIEYFRNYCKDDYKKMLDVVMRYL